ncbi:MAG TPA: response regulator [Candidatus Aquabacterium excrementipullorum]|nr:response regulator [Candidatus Aquabacterium excrementipullorum]
MVASRPKERRDPAWVGFLIVVSLAAILWIDLLTPLGMTEWVFYLVPVGVCLLQSRANLPIGAAVVATIFMVIGFWQSPPGMDQMAAATNRACGVLALWGLAWVVRSTVTSRQQIRRLMWVQQGRARVAEALLGEQTVRQSAQNALDALCAYLAAPLGLVYRVDEDKLVLEAARAHDAQDAGAPATLRMGQGVTGQVARDARPMLVADSKEQPLLLRSGLTELRPRRVVSSPLTADQRVNGVLEVALTDTDTPDDELLDLMAAVSETVGMALRTALYRERLLELLAQTQRQSEELQVQQEELRVSNEELEEQSRVLQESQSRLEEQQVELEQTNVRLEEQTQNLERQKRDLLLAHQAIELNARRLAQASQYKSEFLANMSHELRTPLNSSLILSKILFDNKLGNLSDEQVSYAQTIHAANNDLLTLINDILDLSKIEAGHVEIHPELVATDALFERLMALFKPMAAQKGLSLETVRAPQSPSSLITDTQRLEQVLKNLLSNALKFTTHGGVELGLRAEPGERLAFWVRDTGLGIAEDQQEIIFEAFRQADGTTSRRFGGTGLGLSISRELAHLLGGEISVQSAPGAGSTFTVVLPRTLTPATPVAPDVLPAPVMAAPSRPPADPYALPAQARSVTAPVPLQTRVTQPHEGDTLVAEHVPAPAAATSARKTILAVEDDPKFARVLCDLVGELDFDCVIAATGHQALTMAHELKPCGILLDIGLPDQSGLTVLEQLKRSPHTRHIPVHMVSLNDRTNLSLQLGAIGHAVKPVAREDILGAVRKLQERLQSRIKRVLVVEDDPVLLDNIGLLLGNDEVQVVKTGTVAGALDHLRSSTFDCMVMDLALPDGSGHDLLDQMSEGLDNGFPPVIVYTGRALTRDEEQRLRRHSKSIIVKGARSPERLLDEVTLFLHSVESTLPTDQQLLLRQARQRDAAFEGRVILLVEDDVRNIFALSKVLEPLGATLKIARDGREALSQLDQLEAVDLVLMDIMMPEMDGLTAMRRIREQARWAQLPIIALTAKAMADDRQECLDAGADDYIAKPIDVDRLVSLCRVWMGR